MTIWDSKERCLQKKHHLLTHEDDEQALKVEEFGAVLLEYNSGICPPSSWEWSVSLLSLPKTSPWPSILCRNQTVSFVNIEANLLPFGLVQVFNLITIFSYRLGCRTQTINLVLSKTTQNCWPEWWDLLLRTLQNFRESTMNLILRVSHAHKLQ